MLATLLVAVTNATQERVMVLVSASTLHEFRVTRKEGISARELPL